MKRYEEEKSKYTYIISYLYTPKIDLVVYIFFKKKTSRFRFGKLQKGRLIPI